MPAPETWLREAIEDATSVPAYPLVVPEGATPPFVVYWRDSTQRERQFGGQPSSAVGTFQVQVWADGFGDVKALADQVRVATNNFSGEVDGLTIDATDLADERDGVPVFLEGRDRPTYCVEHRLTVRWQE
jgi:hypothetical protein